MFDPIYTYAPDEVALTFGGYIVEGWDSITVKRSSPAFQIKRGIRGKNTRVRNRDTSAVITLVCPQTSNVNKILTDLVTQDEITGNGRLSLSLIDGSGWEVFSSSEAFVDGLADREYEANESDREWVITCLNSSSRGQNRRSIYGDIAALITEKF